MKLATGVLALCSTILVATLFAHQPHPAKYEATVASLDTHPLPAW
jgi:hypothetical protein